MRRLNRYAAFYSLHRVDHHVPADRPVDVDEFDAYALLNRLEDGDFLGLIDAKGTTLQVTYGAADDQYWIEIPQPESQGSYGRHVSGDEIRGLFKALPERFTVSAFPGFTFRAWSSME
jgi:hypothetical protein